MDVGSFSRVESPVNWCLPVFRGRGDPFTLVKTRDGTAKIGPYLRRENRPVWPESLPRSTSPSALSALERVSSAAVVIDATGRATQMNLSAQNLLGGDFNLVVQGRPASRDPASTIAD